MHFADGGGELQLDHRDNVHFACVQGAGNCLGRKTGRGNCELKLAGRNVRESELAIVVCEGFDYCLRRRLAIERQLHVGADDGSTAFIRDLTADRARCHGRIGAASVTRLMNGGRLRLSERDRRKDTERDTEAEKRQRIEGLQNVAAAATGGICERTRSCSGHHSNFIAFAPTFSKV